MKRLIFTITLFSYFLPCRGNGDIIINIGQKNMPFIKFISEINEKYNITVFYERTWVEDIKLKQEFKNTPLKNVLQVILEEHSLGFFIRENYVIITKNMNLNFSLYTSDSLTKEQMTEDKITDTNVISLQEQEYIIHQVGNYTSKKKAKLYGYIKHYESKTPLSGVEIYLSDKSYGITSDKNGYYELTLSPDSYVVHFKHIGLKQTFRKIKLKGDGRIDVELMSVAEKIEEVSIFAGTGKVRRIEMGLENVDASVVKNFPIVLGEADIIKSATMLAGVESSGEGTVGFNVRGGSADQNLILIDNAPIYYPAHFFGFFPAFNFDIIQEANLYKASIPAQLGGRVSSAYDIHTKENGIKKFKGKAGISPVTSKLYLETPILHNKISLFNSFRFTYSNWILKLIDSKELINSTLKFNDLQSKICYKPNQNNQLKLSYYNSSDQFKLHSDTLYKFVNHINSFNWRNIINENFKMNNSIYNSYFSYNLSTKSVPVNAFELEHRVNETGAKIRFTYSKDVSKIFDFGAATKYYSITPGDIKQNSDSSLIQNRKIDPEKGLETVLFFSAKYHITPKISAETGIRYSLFGNIGRKKELIFTNNIPNLINITDTLNNKSFRNIYQGPEYRLGFSYEINQTASFKVSYNRTRQYIHRLSNTTAISPTDNWKLSDKYMKPQIGDQYSAGLYKNLENSLAEISIETYYKHIDNIKDYKNGAQLYLNEHVETDVINGIGKAYGIEFQIAKKTRRVKGSLSYTYSRSYFKSRHKTGEFVINNGKYYNSPFDKPHNIKAFLNLNLSRRFVFSLNLVHHTGRPATYPVAKYEFKQIPISYYSNRNEYRLPDYFRMDLSVLIQGNLKQNKKTHSTIFFGIYNITGRKNAYSVYFKSENDAVVGYKLSIFGQAIPTLTYNIEF